MCVVRDAVVVVTRDVVGVATVPRDVAVRDATPREFTTVLLVVPRDTTFVEFPRDVTGRARIDTNVEHTKNAPASKNTVPIAFLKFSAKLWRFIKLSL